MAQEVEVQVKVNTASAVSGVDNLGKSFSNLDKTVGKTQEKQRDYAKEILHSSVLSQKLSQATGGLSDSLMGAVKGIDTANISLKAMKGAIMSTGIGLLVIAIGELITMLADFYSAEKRSEKAVESMNNALDKQNELYNNLSGELEQNIKITKLQAEISGASAKQLVEIDRKALKERQALNEKFIQEQLANMDKLRNNEELSTEDYQAQSKKLDEQLQKGLAKRLELQRGGTIATLEAKKKETEESNKIAEDASSKANAAAEKKKQDAIQQSQALKSLEQKYQDDIENMQDTTAQKKLDRQKERAIEELDKIKMSETAKLEAVKLINEDFRLKQEALDKTQDDRLLALSSQFAKDKEDLLAKTDEDKLNLKIKRDTLALETELATMTGDDEKKQALRLQLDEKNDILVKELATKRAEEKNLAKQTELEQTSANEQLEFDVRLQALKDRDLLIDAQTNLTDAQRIEAKKKNKELVDGINKQVVASEKAKEDAKYNIARAGIASLSSLTSIMFGEGKKAQAVQKGLALAQIGIDTASAFSSLMRGSEAAAVATGPAYPLAKPIFYASGIVQILANIAKAKQALSSSDTGGGSEAGATAPASIPTIPQAPPSANIVGDSGVNQIAETLGSQQPVQAYVVANNVTTAQSLNRNIINSASLG